LHRLVASELNIKAVTALVGSTVLGLFRVEPEYLLLTFVLLLADFVTGVVKAKRNKLKISSIGFRQTIVKIVEYIGLLLVFIWTANTFADKGLLSFAQHIDDIAFFIIAMTELKSITENLGKTAFWNRVVKMLKSKSDGMLEDEEDE
jgi:phage-related holin